MVASPVNMYTEAWHSPPPYTHSELEKDVRGRPFFVNDGDTLVVMDPRDDPEKADIVSQDNVPSSTVNVVSMPLSFPWPTPSCLFPVLSCVDFAV